MIDLYAPANFSEGPDHHRHRWSLARHVSILGERPLVICGYNPSIAAETANDPTISREIALANRLGAGWLVKVNLFAAVATNANELIGYDDPVGGENDATIRAAIDLAADRDGWLIAAWGIPKGRAATQRLARMRMPAVAAMSDRWHALRITASGHPEHPLYLPGNLLPAPWKGYA